MVFVSSCNLLYFREHVACEFGTNLSNHTVLIDYHTQWNNHSE
uniref:Uncharacterized protein n=1 Tax=Arundo donax TaxID=35708 RepID=A0A0A9GDU1_ARUDO